MASSKRIKAVIGVLAECEAAMDELDADAHIIEDKMERLQRELDANRAQHRRLGKMMNAAKGEGH